MKISEAKNLLSNAKVALTSPPNILEIEIGQEEHVTIVV
jgi:hypothetical protein